MNYKRIAKWTKALESGEYRQTKRTLYNSKTYGFCCLGVLTNEFCEVKNLDFDYITGFQAAYDYKLRELEDDCLYSLSSEKEKKQEAYYDAEGTLEVTSVETPVKNWIGLRSKVNFKDLKFEPHVHRKYMGNIYSHNPIQSPTDILSTLNDGGVKFKDIAKFIKDNKKVLFK